MREILFLAHRVPWPPDRGDKIRSWNLVRYMGARCKVHLAAFTEGEDQAEAVAALAPLVESVTLVKRGRGRGKAAAIALATGRPVSLTAFESPLMRSVVRQIARVQPLDGVFVFSSQMAPYARGLDLPLIMDFVDVDSAKFEAYAGRQGRALAWLMRREARLLLAHDLAVARRARASLFVSEAEAALFRDLGGGDGVIAVGNGIDAIRFDPATVTPEASDKPLIVFTGQMDYPPNVDAVMDFADHVLPDLPGTTFAIVGRNPTPVVRALARRERVIVTGEVTDTRPWLAAADVVVAPLMIARGVQNKVLEAMAMARPIVASPQAAEGIDHDGTLRIADRASQAGEIRALIADPASAAELGRAARARVIESYGWDARLAPLDPLLA